MTTLAPRPVPTPAQDSILAILLAAIPSAFTAKERTRLAQLAQDSVVDRADEALTHWTIFGAEVLKDGVNARIEARSLATELPIVWMALARLHPAPQVAEFLRPIERICRENAALFLSIHEAHPQLPTAAVGWLEDAAALARVEEPKEPADGWDDEEYAAVLRQTADSIRQRAGDLLDGLDDMDLQLAAFGAWSTVLAGEDAQRANNLALDAINHILPCTEWVQNYPYAFGSVTSLCVAAADATRVDVGEEYPDLEMSLLKYAGIMESGVQLLTMEEANDLDVDTFLGPIPDMIADLARKRTTCVKPSGPPVDMIHTVAPGIHPVPQTLVLRQVAVPDHATVSDETRAEMKSWIDRHNATPKQPKPAVTYIKP